MKDKLVRIGVFYDGNYFFRVSSYYAYGHQRKSRLSISGLHDFIRHQVADEEKSDTKLCQIVDAHYFRGRLNAFEASQRGDTLYWDRVFDDILMSEGVTTHYLPVKTVEGQKQEKGIDVWLALEAFELAFYKKFDVLVLIASDGDYVPLIRKLNTIGTRVMALSWDFEYTDDTGRRFTTRTSQDLLEEASYPIAMHEIIDNRLRRNEPLINNMFVQSDFRRPQATAKTTTPISAIATPTTPSVVSAPPADGVFVTSSIDQATTPAAAVVPVAADPTQVHRSEVLSLKDGYGFIKFPPNNLFFHYSDVIGVDFNELCIGDIVEFSAGIKENGRGFATNVRLVE